MTNPKTTRLAAVAALLLSACGPPTRHLPQHETDARTRAACQTYLEAVGLPRDTPMSVRSRSIIRANGANGWAGTCDVLIGGRIQVLTCYERTACVLRP